MSVSRKNFKTTVFKPKKAGARRTQAVETMEVIVPTRGQASMIPRYRNTQMLNRRESSQELGFVDLARAVYGCNTSGSITLIATVAQGASINQRIGKRAFWRSLLIRGRLQTLSTTIADVGFLIVYDRKPTGALPAITDILTSVSTNAFMNDNNTTRFEIIRRVDKCLIGNAATPTTGQEAYNIDMFIPLKKRPVVFESAGTGAIGDIDTGALYLVTIGDQAPASGGQLDVAFRTKFTEY